MLRICFQCMEIILFRKVVILADSVKEASIAAKKKSRIRYFRNPCFKNLLSLVRKIGVSALHNT